MAESIVLDPDEVSDARLELEITPIVAVDGIDWGTAAIEAYMSEGERGAVPVDFTFPNRKITIPIVLKDVSATQFETWRRNLQAKVARFQAEGGWFKRQRGSDAPIFADVVNAELTIPDSITQALYGFEPKAELVLECLFDFYEEEVELTAGAVTGTSYASTVLTTARGDYPARCRIEVTETDSEQARGLIAAFRSRHYDSESTASCRYEAEDLTPISPASVVTLSGASGGGSNNAVRHNALFATWNPVLSTNLSGGDYLTHTGTYRCWATVQTSSATPPEVRFVYDVGDLILPEENDPVQIPGANAKYLVDLGTVRLDKDPIGTHRWQGQIQAKGAVGGENVYVDEVYFFAQDEWYSTVSSPTVSSAASSVVVGYDQFDQSAGNLTGKVAPFGGTWTGGTAGTSTSDDGDADDWVAGGPGTYSYRAANNDSNLNNGRYVNLGTATYTNVAVRADIAQGVQNLAAEGSAGHEMRTGVYARFVDTDNWLIATRNHVVIGGDEINGATRVGLYKRVAGAVTTLGSVVLSTTQDAGWHSLSMVVDEAGNVAVYDAPGQLASSSSAVISVLADTHLKTGGALATGKVGIYDAINYTPGSTLYRILDNFYVGTPVGGSVTDDAILFAGRKAQLRTSGNYREASDGGSYGPVSVSLGRLPRVPAEGLEGREAELFMRRSRGDLDTIADTGADTLSFRVYANPSWVYAPGT